MKLMNCCVCYCAMRSGLGFYTTQGEFSPKATEEEEEDVAADATDSTITCEKVSYCLS